MYRFVALFCSACVFFAGCSSSPHVTGTVTLAKYGAGSIEDDGSAPNKAASPANFRKLKAEEILSRVTISEEDMEASLAVPNYDAAMKSYDTIVELLANVSQSADRLQADRAKMEKALDGIVFETVSAPGETNPGTAFKKNFTVRVLAVTANGKVPLSGFGCTVFYPATSDDGTQKTVAESRSTSADGTLSWTAAVPSKTGKGTLIIAAALSSRDGFMKESLRTRQEKGQLAVAFRHNVVSNAKTFSTAISILDFDRDGNPLLSTNTSATILLQPLVARGFHRIGMADFPKQLASGDENLLISAAKAQFGSGVRRFIYGTTHYESLVLGDNGLWSCTISADVSVWDFSADAKVYHTTARYTETAKAQEDAIGAVRQKLAGDILVNDLYFNM